MQKQDLNYCPVNSGPTKYTAIQTIIYSLLLIPVGVIPYFIGMSGTSKFSDRSGCKCFYGLEMCSIVQEYGCAECQESYVQQLYLFANSFIGIAGQKYPHPLKGCLEAF